MLSNRIQKLRPSATLAINAKAIELQKQGVDIIKFGTGEPDFDTPEHIKQAAKQALDEGFTKYTAATGITELKTAVADKLRRDNNIICIPEDIIITVGGKHALYNIFMALLNPGDEALLPSPYWVSYADQILVCGGVVKTIDTRPNRFKLTAQMVEESISPKTKVLILNSPSNPTGMVIEKEEIIKIADLAQKHNFYLISDEVYEYFLYDGKAHFSAGSLPELKDLVFTVNAVSKTYSMTGWRIGYLTGPGEFMKAISSLQSHSTSNPCSIAQKAALAALTGPQDSIQTMLSEFQLRRDYVQEAFNKIPGIKLDRPEGAFYAFPDISGTGHDSFAFTELMMEKAKVAVVPGAAFGEEGNNYIRFSFAASMEHIKEGLSRIEKALT